VIDSSDTSYHLQPAPATGGNVKEDGASGTPSRIFISTLEVFSQAPSACNRQDFMYRMYREVSCLSMVQFRTTPGGTRRR
jgi:hypothetical protein